MKVTLPQIRKIWSLARELGWDRERLHRWMDESFGWKSVAALQRDQAVRMIDRMEWVAGAQRRGSEGEREQGREGERERGRGEKKKERKGYREFRQTVDAAGKIQYYCTPAQIAKLRALAYRMQWGDMWILRVAARKLGRSLTGLVNIKADEMPKVMGAVEGLVLRRERELAQRKMFGEEGGEGERERGMEGEREEVREGTADRKVAEGTEEENG
jgi:hypothetical protein